MATLYVILSAERMEKRTVFGSKGRARLEHFLHTIQVRLRLPGQLLDQLLHGFKLVAKVIKLNICGLGRNPYA